MAPAGTLLNTSREPQTLVLSAPRSPVLSTPTDRELLPTGCDIPGDSHRETGHRHPGPPGAAGDPHTGGRVRLAGGTPSPRWGCALGPRPGQHMGAHSEVTSTLTPGAEGVCTPRWGGSGSGTRPRQNLLRCLAKVSLQLSKLLSRKRWGLPPRTDGALSRAQLGLAPRARLRHRAARPGPPRHSAHQVTSSI